MTQDLKQQFASRLNETRSGMLSAGAAPAVPMSHFYEAEKDDAVLWFITSKGTELAQAAQKQTKGQYLISDNDAQLYARVDGVIRAENDPATLERIWSFVADAWFEEGKQDDDVQLLRMDMRAAEVWITGGSLKFFYEMAKANLTDTRPDLGQHGHLHF